MSLATDLAADFDTMLDDFGVSTTHTTASVAVNAVKNSQDKDVIYSEMNNKSVEYRFTLWFDSADFGTAGISVPDVHDTIATGGITYLVAKRTYDPLNKLVAFDMVEQYG